jgi:lysophospholipase L1-like esterase
MKKLSLLLFALCAHTSWAAETRDLILVAGQSNAVGFNAKPTELPANPVDEKIMFWWRCGDPPPDERDSTSAGKWTHLQAQPLGDPRPPRADRQYGNFAQPEGGFGPEIGFARTLFAQEHKPLAVVKAAFSGTSLGGDWNSSDPGPAGSCYRALVSEAKAAIAAAKAQDVALRLRALVWVQGESDANVNAAPRYEKALGDMIAALRRDLDAPQLIALLALNTHFGGDKNPFVPKIADAQRALASKDPRCAYVDTSAASIANAAHFDTAGTIEVGGLFARALLKLEAGVNEPTNAAEAAAKKAAEDKAIDEQYQKWKAALSPEQQAWETVLEQNLGSFYLPIHKREKVRGISNAWDFVADDPKLPRVLLIGDSVSRGYTLGTRKALAGKANVHRAPENCGPTANGLKKLNVWLGEGKWDVIHFNFGIHDRATPAADYEQRLNEIVTRLKATGAKVIWASTTPVPPDTKDGPAATEAILEKNRIAAQVMQKQGVATDDLFSFINPHLAKVQNPKDVHFSAEGYDLLGQQVATSIRAALK